MQEICSYGIENDKNILYLLYDPPNTLVIKNNSEIIVKINIEHDFKTYFKQIMAMFPTFGRMVQGEITGDRIIDLLMGHKEIGILLLLTNTVNEYIKNRT